MASTSVFDALFSLFGGSVHLAAWLPGLLIRLCGLWLAAVGWKRHRVLGFMLFFVASAIGVASSVFVAIGMSRSTQMPGGASSVYSAATSLGYLSAILSLCALGHLAFRATFAPPVQPQIYKP